jgi:hypothetical protein
MGDEGAMGQLMGRSPQTAMMIQQQQQQSTKRSRQEQMDKLSREKFAFEQKKFAQDVKKYEAKQSGGADGYAGTAMPAQISNMLDKGVTDPEFRKTPDYARAYQLATAPNFVDTPKGRVPIYPNLPDIFKPPEGMQAAPRGVVPGTEKRIKYTGEQDKSYGYAIRMDEAAQEMVDVTGRGFDPESGYEKGMASVLWIGNYLASEEYQLYDQASTNWVTANLRQESGAVIGIDEMENEKKKYFPQPGDTKAVIKQKKKSRKKAEEGMRAKSGRKEGRFEQEMPKKSKAAEETKMEMPPKPDRPAPEGVDPDLWKFMEPEERALF